MAGNKSNEGKVLTLAFEELEVVAHTSAKPSLRAHLGGNVEITVVDASDRHIRQLQEAQVIILRRVPSKW